MIKKPPHQYIYFFALLLFLTSPVLSQGVGSIFGSGSNENEQKILFKADEELVIENATQSFVEAAQDRIDELLNGNYSESTDKRGELEKIALEEVEKYEEKVIDKLSELRGDGALTIIEVTKSLSAMREQELADLLEYYRATLEGYSRPPEKKDYNTIFLYAGALLQYAFLERNPLINWILYLALVLGSFGVVRVTMHFLKKWSGNHSGKWSRPVKNIASSAEYPIYLGVITIAMAIGLKWIWIPVELNQVVLYILQFAFVASLFWLLWNLSDNLSDFVSTKQKEIDSEFDERIVDIVTKCIRLMFILVFIVFASEVIFDTNLKATLAGFGLLGLAITLALQGTLKNLIASFTIYGDRPFHVGDFVKYKDYSGPIEKIGFRSTQLRTFDGHLITIPNADIINEDIENAGARPWIRRRFRIDIPYSTPIKKIKKAIEIVDDILSNADGRPSDEDHHVALEDFGPHSLKVLVQYYYEPPDYWEALENDTKINFEIMNRFEEEGIDFAFPTERVYLDTDNENILNSKALQTNGINENSGNDSDQQSEKKNGKKLQPIEPDTTEEQNNDDSDDDSD